MLSRPESELLLARLKINATEADEAIGLVIRETASDPPANSGLSIREEEVLALLVRGHGSIEIGKRLEIGPKTVDTHRSRLLKKLGLRGNVELAYFAIWHGWIATPDLLEVWSRPRSPSVGRAGRANLTRSGGAVDPGDSDAGSSGGPA